jgi:hypothetical protein
MMPDEEPPERRQQSRRRVLLGGMVASADGSITAECVIRNLNERGALIKTDAKFGLDAKLYLIDARLHHVYVARVARLQGETEIALQFHQARSIGAVESPAREFLMPLFLRAKLMQIRILWNHGYSPEEILEETHVDFGLLQLAEGRSDVGIEFNFLLDRLRKILRERQSPLPRSTNETHRDRLASELRPPHGGTGL